MLALLSSVYVCVSNTYSIFKSCDWIFKSLKGSLDYHDEKNVISIEEWLEQRLLSPLSRNTLNTMDNARLKPYNNKYWQNYYLVLK